MPARRSRSRQPRVPGPPDRGIVVLRSRCVLPLLRLARYPGLADPRGPGAPTVPALGRIMGLVSTSPRRRRRRRERARGQFAWAVERQSSPATRFRLRTLHGDRSGAAQRRDATRPPAGVLDGAAKVRTWGSSVDTQGAQERLTLDERRGKTLTGRRWRCAEEDGRGRKTSATGRVGRSLGCMVEMADIGEARAEPLKRSSRRITASRRPQSRATGAGR